MSQALMTQYRAEFASMCISRRLYLMFSLLMQASLRYDESIPTACVGYSPVSGFTITFGKKFVEAGLLPFTFVLAHELRHVVQMGTAPDLSQFSRRTLLNIAMDASLHEDLRLLLPDEWKAILAMDGFRPCSVEGLESDLRAIEARLSVPPD